MPELCEQAKIIVDLVNALTESEQAQLARALWNHPVLGKENRELLSLCAQLLELSHLMATKLASRDRKSDPETLKKDEEIHSLRTNDSRHWSWNRLASHFKMTTRGTQKAFERHANRIQVQNEAQERYDQWAQSDEPLTTARAYVNELLARYQTAN